MEVFHFDISGNEDNDSQSRNIPNILFILFTFEVFNFDKSGKAINESHEQNVKLKSIGFIIKGEDFVKRNKKNCKLIIDGKEQELKEKYSFGIFSSKKDILEIKLKGITNITNMSYMFDRCESLSSLPDISKWNTSNVTDMSGMFFGCNESLKIPSKFY